MEINIETLSDEQKAELQAKLSQSNKEEDGSDYEKRYKDTQASYTKANEEKLTYARKLAQANPKNILDMDAKTQAKVIKDEFGYESLDELKIMKPDIFEEKDNGGVNLDGGDDENKKLQRELALLKMQRDKDNVEWAIDSYISNNPKVAEAIPSFKEKIAEELKYISSKLPAKERVERATKLVTSNSNTGIEAYLSLQGKSYNKTPKAELNDDAIRKAQNALREQLWLKTK